MTKISDQYCAEGDEHLANAELGDPQDAQRVQTELLFAIANYLRAIFQELPAD